MARTEFDASETGGDNVPRETVAARSGSTLPDLGAIDVRLDEIGSNEPEQHERVKSTPKVHRSEAVQERVGQPRELLSELTDLNVLMAAILGDDVREQVPVEGAAQSPSIEHPEAAPENRSSLAVELETLLSAEPPRESAAVIRTPPSATPAPVTSGRFSTLRRLGAAIPRWPTSRVSLLTVSALAGMTLGVVAWHSGKTDPADLPTSSNVTTAAGTSPTTNPRSGALPRNVSTDAVTGSPAPVGSSGEPRSGSLRRGVNATSNNNARGRRADTDAAAEGRAPATARSRRATAPRPPSRPTESASSRDTAPAPEPQPGRTEIVYPPQSPARVAPSVTESITPPLSNAASPATVTAGGATTGSARPEPPAAAPALPMQRTEPRLLRRAVPEYPNQLRRAKVGGTVTVTMTVDAEGRVTNVRSISGPAGLRPAAEAAAQRWRYEPATVNGKPSESSVNVTFTFDPSDAPQNSR